MRPVDAILGGVHRVVGVRVVRKSIRVNNLVRKFASDHEDVLAICEMVSDGTKGGGWSWTYADDVPLSFRPKQEE
jgi:hypothetical protein